MAQSRKGKTPPTGKTEQPRSAIYAARGITTASDLAGLMSALISDVLENRVSPGVSNATCQAAGKLLKVTELQYKYGTQRPGADRPTLALTGPETETRKPATLIAMKRKRKAG